MKSITSLCMLVVFYFFSKVVLLEDGEGKVHMKNLSMYPATNEEEGKYSCVVLNVHLRAICTCSSQLVIYW